MKLYKIYNTFPFRTVVLEGEIAEICAGVTKKNSPYSLFDNKEDARKFLEQCHIEYINESMKAVEKSLSVIMADDMPYTIVNNKLFLNEGVMLNKEILEELLQNYNVVADIRFIGLKHATLLSFNGELIQYRNVGADLYFCQTEITNLSNIMCFYREVN